MKISISYPPLESEKGIPLLGQNRQFQWFSEPTYIYPMVPAYAATLLKTRGHEVLWDDGIAEGLSYAAWLERVKAARPDVIALETKTPVVKRHWKIVSELKALPGDWRPKVVLMGDHVTALPEESMRACPVDYILTGGDYDFLLADLCSSLSGGGPLPKGVWYRDGGEIKNTGPCALDNDLDSLPVIDRDLTKWRLYSEKNGNYKYLPGTYTMAARDCWWGKCTFCSWTTLFPGKKYRARSAEKMLDEVGVLIEKYGVKEIMDDSGSFPVGPWLRTFCEGMIARGYHKRVKMDCNMRFGTLTQAEYDLMAKAGFRFVLFGLESANQATLDRIDKHLKVEQIEEGARMAKKAGLSPHITVMMGYPWESREDAARTVAFAKELFRRGWVDTLQATIVIPYPGTPLFKECRENGWLLTEDWDRFDMREAVMKSPMTEDDTKALTRALYKSFATPGYVLRRLVGVRSAADVKFLARAGKKLLGHLTDFKR
jgi:radical SAM superfamily enzyme YgiQ (UPF0313 family)